MQKHYTILELSKSPLKECVKETAEIHNVTDAQVVEYLTQAPTITVIINNAAFEIGFTDNDRQVINDIVKKNNKKGSVSFEYIEDLFIGEFNKELHRGGTQITFTMGTFSDAAKKSAYTKAGQIARFWNKKAIEENSYSVSYFVEHRWVQVEPSHRLFGWVLYYNMV